MQKTIVLNDATRFGIHPQLFQVLRGIAIDLARAKVETSGFADLTDNSTGTVAAAFTNVPVTATSFDATASGGVQTAALNTSLGKFENASKVLVNALNKVRSVVGLPNLTTESGTEASANTIPAQDKTATSASGSSSVDFQSARNALNIARANLGRLMAGFNQVQKAIGVVPTSAAAYHGNFADLDLINVPTVTSSSDGSDSMATADATAALAALANNLATLAAAWNKAFNQGTFSALTDSTGGTPATGLVANVLPEPAAGAATTSSPKTGFDTQLSAINDGLSELATKMNEIRVFYDLPAYTDSTGATPNGTLSAISATLTAVDGSSGTDAVEPVTALARMTSINNALSSLAVGINDLVGFAGLASLTDDLEGTASTTIPAIAATATGVGGADTLLDTDVDAWLSITRNNISTLAAKINAIVAVSQISTRPLTVVAG